MLGLLKFIPGVSKLATGIGGMILKGKEMKHGNKENREIRDAANKASARSQFAQEFIKPENWFDSLVNGLNRLPRPFLALGTIGLFVYAFIDPVGFSATMASLNLVPAELWYLLGAIVSFYFGVRELSSSRKHTQIMTHLNNKQAQVNSDQSGVINAADTADIDNPPLTKLQQFRKSRGK